MTSSKQSRSALEKLEKVDPKHNPQSLQSRNGAKILKIKGSTKPKGQGKRQKQDKQG